MTESLVIGSLLMLGAGAMLGALGLSVVQRVRKTPLPPPEVVIFTDGKGGTYTRPLTWDTLSPLRTFPPFIRTWPDGAQNVLTPDGGEQYIGGLPDNMPDFATTGVGRYASSFPFLTPALRDHVEMMNAYYIREGRPDQVRRTTPVPH